MALHFHQWQDNVVQPKGSCIEPLKYDCHSKLKQHAILEHKQSLVLVCAAVATGNGHALEKQLHLSLCHWHCPFLLVAQLGSMVVVAFQHISDLHTLHGVACLAD